MREKKYYEIRKFKKKIILYKEKNAYKKSHD